MRGRNEAALLAFVITFSVMPGGFAQPRLSSVEAEDISIVYPGPSYEYLVPHVAASINNSLEFHRELFEWDPDGRITVFLEDFGDYGHGSANTVPNNFIRFGVAPFSYVYETMPAIDRMYWLANHEVAHLATMDQAAGRDRFWRKFFAGKVMPNATDPLTIYYNYLTNPRWNAPRWYHEGIAVFLETWMSGGLGRALGAYDEMVFRSMVRDDAHFYDVVGLESEGTTTDFQVGANSYLYGTRFMSYLAYAHGPEKVIEWTARKPGSKAHFASQFRHVFSAPMREEWQAWIDFEHEWQGANLEAIRENPTTASRELSRTALGSVSRSFVDQERGKLYVAIRYPGQIAHVAALDLETGEIDKLFDLTGAAVYYVTSIAYDPDRRWLFYTTDNYEWRDLYVFELDTGKNRRLANDFRVGDLAFNRSDSSLWGIQHFNGVSSIVRIPAPYDSWQEVHTFPYGSDLYDIDVSPDGSLVTGGLAEVDGSQSLVMFRVSELANRTARAQKVFDFGDSLAANFTFSPDGRSLYGTSYYSGVSNVYRYDLDAAEMFVMTNAETGFFRPQPFAEDKLLAFRYSGEGFVAVELEHRDIDNVSAIRFLGTALAEEKPIVREWLVGSPADAKIEVSEPGGYSTPRRMKLQSVYPIIEGYKDSKAAGVRLNLSDAVGQTALALSASYSPDSELDTDERLHLDLLLDHWKWQLRGTWNRADFYDLFGPTKKSRKGYSLGLEYDDVLLNDEPRVWLLNVGITYWGDLETLPNFQNVAATTDEIVTVWTKVEYEFLRKSLGGVDDERGVHWQLEATADSVDSDIIPRLHTTFDWGFALPINHSSIFLRTSAGHAFGEVEDPFANFFFGGFGNNWVDQGTEKRYREYESFPGLEINEVGGRNFAKAIVEWNLPPVRFQSLGSPSLYLNWARPAIFGGVLTTNPSDSSLERTLYTLGVQLDFKMVLFSNLPSVLSVGYGVAFEDGRSSDEVMVSLKIL